MTRQQIDQLCKTLKTRPTKRAVERRDNLALSQASGVDHGPIRLAR